MQSVATNFIVEGGIYANLTMYCLFEYAWKGLSFIRFFPSRVVLQELLVDLHTSQPVFNNLPVVTSGKG